MLGSTSSSFIPKSSILYSSGGILRAYNRTTCHIGYGQCLLNLVLYILLFADAKFMLYIHSYASLLIVG